MGLGIKFDYYLSHRNVIESVQSLTFFPLNKASFFFFPFCSSTSKLKSKFTSLPLRANLLLLYFGTNRQEVRESVITAASFRRYFERRCVSLVFVQREAKGRPAAAGAAQRDTKTLWWGGGEIISIKVAPSARS